MSDASKIAADAAISKLLFEEVVFRETVEGTLVGQMGGVQKPYDPDIPNLLESGPDNVIQQKTNLEINGNPDMGKGGQLQMSIVKRTTAAPVRGFDTLEGKEDKLTSYEFTLRPDVVRQAIDRYRISQARSTFSLPANVRANLVNYQRELYDQEAIDAWTDSPTDIFYREGSDTMKRTATVSTAVEALTATDLLDPDMLIDITTFARTGGVTNLQSDAQRKVRPAMIDNEKLWVLITHPDSVADMAKDSEYRQAILEARERGRNNPFFKIVMMVINNVAIIPHPFVPVVTNTSGVRVCKGIFAGAQSLLWGWGNRPEFIEETFDFKEKLAIAIRMVYQVKKPKFNGIDYGSYGLYLACSNLSNLTIN